MIEYGEVLLVAIPAFVVLILIEKIYGMIVSSDYTPWPDAISSMSSGITNILKDVLGIWTVLLAYGWLLDHLAIFNIPSTLIVILIAFVCVDFAYYWIHRWQHKINILWNEHIIHHSSEEFNLACALRQTISVFIKWHVLLFFPAVLGVPESIMAIVVPIHLFMQFWYHTRHIGKMGFLEHIIVTPSHHRVHHAINKEYMDKNFSAIIIVWDKLFGTFQQEIKDVEPIYGVTRPVQTWNPFKINFQHLWILIKDAYYSKSFLDGIIIWFKPTGWRPNKSEKTYSIQRIEDPKKQQKYNTKMSGTLQFWSGLQLLFNLFLTIVLFSSLRYLSYDEMISIGVLVFVGIYSFTDLMDLNRYNWIFEFSRVALIFIFIQYELLNSINPLIQYFIVSWMLISLIHSFFVCYRLNQIVIE